MLYERKAMTPSLMFLILMVQDKAIDHKKHG